MTDFSAYHIYVIYVLIAVIVVLGLAVGIMWKITTNALFHRDEAKKSLEKAKSSSGTLNHDLAARNKALFNTTWEWVMKQSCNIASSIEGVHSSHGPYEYFWKFEYADGALLACFKLADHGTCLKCYFGPDSVKRAQVGDLADRDYWADPYEILTEPRIAERLAAEAKKAKLALGNDAHRVIKFGK